MSEQKNNTPIFWSYADKFGNKLLTFIVYIVLAIKLEPTDFGIIAIARIFIDYTDTLSNQGVGLTIIQRDKVDNEVLNVAFWLNLLIASLAVLIISFVAPYIASHYELPSLNLVLKILSITVLLNAFGRIHGALLERTLQYKTLAIIGIISSISGAATALFMVYNDYGIWSMVAQQVVVSSVTMILLWSFHHWVPGMSFNISKLLELLKFGSKLVLDQQFYFVSKKIDEAMILSLMGPILLGYYSVAKKYYHVIQGLAFEPLLRVILSSLSRQQHDHKNYSFKFAQNIEFTTFFIFPIFLGLSLISTEILIFTVGEKWIVGANALSLLFISSAIMITSSIIHMGFISRGRPEYNLYSNIIKVLAFVICFPFLSEYELIGIAIAVNIRELAGLIFDLTLVEKVTKLKAAKIIRTNVRNIIPALSMFICGLTLKTYTDLEGITLLVILIPICVIVHTAIACQVNRDTITQTISLLKHYKMQK